MTRPAWRDRDDVVLTLAQRARAAHVSAVQLAALTDREWQAFKVGAGVEMADPLVCADAVDMVLDWEIHIDPLDPFSGADGGVWRLKGRENR